MLDYSQQDELTGMEKKVYRYVACTMIGADLYLMVLVATGSAEGNIWVGLAGFLLLMIGVVFGWGRNKNVRVLDLRMFNKR
ncbi:LPXTG cell wall anchor domain-containing protein [Paraburkholderia rhizosphaerae]|uniref:LPXTG-motif cell wall-anchored protein n=1 Tax=Paraburkholderia rhizosphaerae TaxID=480658 RepID=A0A4R8L3K5_9BURK|nr:LPXTG cell wall anchor domain-containing protein [Paraburkholderia rhizosphaerae]TDY37043.1 LPXTG-motif cell wall-anchored protein [Paraburkholderia rhizosphaerae]